MNAYMYVGRSSGRPTALLTRNGVADTHDRRKQAMGAGDDVKGATQALVASLMLSQVSERERAAGLESQLEKLRNAETQHRAKQESSEAKQASLEAELQVLREQNLQKCDELAVLRADTDRRREKEHALELTLLHVAQQGEALIAAVCSLLLQAQETEGAAPRIETSHGLAAGCEPAQVMRANFEAAVRAFNASVAQTEDLIGSVRGLGEPLAGFRDAIRTATRPHLCASNVAPLANGAARDNTSCGGKGDDGVSDVEGCGEQGDDEDEDDVSDVAPAASDAVSGVDWQERQRQQRLREYEADLWHPKGSTHPRPLHANCRRSSPLHANGRRSSALHANGRRSPPLHANGRRSSPATSSSPQPELRRASAATAAAWQMKSDRAEEESTADQEGDEDEEEAAARASLAAQGLSGNGWSRRALVSTIFEVVVPLDAAPGDTLFVAVAGGDEVKVVVPPGVPPGSVLTCSACTSGSNGSNRNSGSSAAAETAVARLSELRRWRMG
jgi:hypothetical protein